LASSTPAASEKATIPDNTRKSLDMVEPPHLRVSRE
jgi:hypothetical protein